MEEDVAVASRGMSREVDHVLSRHPGQDLNRMRELAPPPRRVPGPAGPRPPHRGEPFPPLGEEGPLEEGRYRWGGQTIDEGEVWSRQGMRTGREVPPPRVNIKEAHLPQIIGGEVKKGFFKKTLSGAKKLTGSVAGKATAIVGALVGLSMMVIIPSMMGFGHGDLYGFALESQWAELFRVGKYKKTMENGIEVWDLAGGGYGADKDLPKDICGNFINPEWWHDLSQEQQSTYKQNKMLGAQCLSKYILKENGSSAFVANSFMGCPPTITSNLCENDPHLCGVFAISTSGGSTETVDCHGNFVDIGAHLGMSSDIALNTPRNRAVRSENGTLVPWRRLEYAPEAPKFLGKPNCLADKTMNRTHCQLGDGLWSEAVLDKKICPNQRIETEKVMKGECYTFARTPRPCSQQGSALSMAVIQDCYEPFDKKTTLAFWGAYAGPGVPTRHIVDIIEGDWPTGLFEPPELNASGTYDPIDYTKIILEKKLIFLETEWNVIFEDCKVNGQAFGNQPLYGGWPQFPGCDYASRDVHNTPDPESLKPSSTRLRGGSNPSQTHSHDPFEREESYLMDDHPVTAPTTAPSPFDLDLFNGDF